MYHIEDGSTTQRLICAIGFSIAGILWIIILFRGSKNTQRCARNYAVAQDKSGILYE